MNKRNFYIVTQQNSVPSVAFELVVLPIKKITATNKLQQKIPLQTLYSVSIVSISIIAFSLKQYYFTIACYELYLSIPRTLQNVGSHLLWVNVLNKAASVSGISFIGFCFNSQAVCRIPTGG